MAGRLSTATSTTLQVDDLVYLQRKLGDNHLAHQPDVNLGCQFLLRCLHYSTQRRLGALTGTQYCFAQLPTADKQTI
ncbi:hypothetical protein Y032_0045g1191 [Ancylostoma ceylanicum]|uniref:Uncharacterized protein n=1 Tax=Ancylostoma ceylanicum TaxID=53326 RepID=A0A016UCU2_9BILA|nr:hypothetical protein Y032_0045g1191 [Ancylostoma ceylanicum]